MDRKRPPLGGPQNERTSLRNSANVTKEPETPEDAYTERLIELAEMPTWRTDVSLLARVLLYAERGEIPSGGLQADIEMHLFEADPAFRAIVRGMSAQRP